LSGRVVLKGGAVINKRVQKIVLRGIWFILVTKCRYIRLVKSWRTWREVQAARLKILEH
jgi:hypothetical protein